jgi:hypothetical protein
MRLNKSIGMVHPHGKKIPSKTFPVPMNDVVDEHCASNNHNQTHHYQNACSQKHSRLIHVHIVP